jgi:hypothetical protein
MMTAYPCASVRRDRPAFSSTAIKRIIFAVFVICAASQSAKSAPELISQANSTRAVALESISWTQEPFRLTQPNPFSADRRTRIMLFAKNVDLLPGEDASAVKAEAEDATRTRYPLTVEYVGAVPGFNWMSAVIVRLHDSWGDIGDVLISITLRGAASNRVRVGIGHVGGGPPDDGGVISPMPDLGAGASLRGKRIFPSDNPWNEDISAMPVDPNSSNLMASMGLNTALHPDFGTVWAGAPNGIPYVVVSGTQSKVPVNFTAYGDESDPGPYPVPPNAPI